MSNFALYLYIQRGDTAARKCLVRILHNLKKVIDELSFLEEDYVEDGVRYYRFEIVNYDKETARFPCATFFRLTSKDGFNMVNYSECKRCVKSFFVTNEL